MQGSRLARSQLRERATGANAMHETATGFMIAGACVFALSVMVVLAACAGINNEPGNQATARVALGGAIVGLVIVFVALSFMAVT